MLGHVRALPRPRRPEALTGAVSSLPASITSERSDGERGDLRMCDEAASQAEHLAEVGLRNEAVCHPAGVHLAEKGERLALVRTVPR